MNATAAKVHVLLVDDEDEFRAATRGPLERRGFSVSEAADGLSGLARIAESRPDVVLLDLKMPRLSGLETLTRIREIAPELPVIVLTGHGAFDSALAGIRLDIVDFMQKPVDIEKLAQRIRALLERPGPPASLRERTIRELMISPDLYPRLDTDQSVAAAVEILGTSLFNSAAARPEENGIRSALVFDSRGEFAGMVRFGDLLHLVIPEYLAQSAYATYFTGMFLAGCKVIGQRSIRDVVERPLTVRASAPLLEAVAMMVEHRRTSLPVVDGRDVVGVLRDRAIVLEIARVMTGG